jgi:carboxypeptidase Q
VRAATKVPALARFIVALALASHACAPAAPPIEPAKTAPPPVFTIPQFDGGAGAALSALSACTDAGLLPDRDTWPRERGTRCAEEAGTERAPIAAPYREAARRILEASLAGDGAWQKVSALADSFGARLSGSPALDRAIEWARDAFARDGQEHVSLEPTRVPVWLRGSESAELTAPISRGLHVLGLGGTVGTPPGGITANVIVVDSFDDLERRKAEVPGTIVLFNHAMSKTGDPSRNYGDAIPYRLAGARRAAPFGAVGVLVRSLTVTSMQTPHTGAMVYADPPARMIPAAAISLEDADYIARLASRGRSPRVHLALGARTAKDAPSANVIAEIRGRETPDEVVVLGAHIDSWDVGQGAQDDGAGCAIVMQSLATLRQIGLVPRRTIRAVLFTNEENGLRGAKQYATDHSAELGHHVAAFEVDTGGGEPLGVTTEGDPDFRDEVRDVASLLAPIGATSVVAGYAGSDVHPLATAGVPLFGLKLDMSTYFDVHHSMADTLDRIDPVHLKKSVAALATMAFVVADRESRWTAPPEPAPAASPSGAAEKSSPAKP